MSLISISSEKNCLIVKILSYLMLICYNNEMCFVQQVRHIHEIILPQFQRDFISLLPKELALYVLSFLPPKDLLRAAQTCKYWNILAADNLLWREKCREAGIEDHVVFMDRRRKKGTSVSHVSPFKVGMSIFCENERQLKYGCKVTD